jgi:hypothetical protein
MDFRASARQLHITDNFTLITKCSAEHFVMSWDIWLSTSRLPTSFIR